MIRCAQRQIQYTVLLSCLQMGKHLSTHEQYGAIISIGRTFLICAVQITEMIFCAVYCLLLRLTVSEVKVRQMPPKPFRDSAKKMSADNTADYKKKNQEMAFNLKAK